MKHPSVTSGSHTFPVPAPVPPEKQLGGPLWSRRTLTRRPHPNLAQWPRVSRQALLCPWASGEALPWGLRAPRQPTQGPRPGPLSPGGHWSLEPPAWAGPGQGPSAGTSARCCPLPAQFLPGSVLGSAPHLPPGGHAVGGRQTPAAGPLAGAAPSPNSVPSNDWAEGGRGALESSGD